MNNHLKINIDNNFFITSPEYVRETISNLLKNKKKLGKIKSIIFKTSGFSIGFNVELNLEELIDMCQDMLEDLFTGLPREARVYFADVERKTAYEIRQEGSQMRIIDFPYDSLELDDDKTSNIIWS